MKITAILSILGLTAFTSAVPAPAARCPRGYSEYWCMYSSARTCLTPQGKSSDFQGQIYTYHYCCNGRTFGAGADGMTSFTSFDSVHGCYKI